MVRQKCDPKIVKESDDSCLSADSAKRAPTNAGILSTRERARRMADEITRLHGLGGSAMPVERAALKKLRRNFRPSPMSNDLRLVFACIQLCYNSEIPI
jgi:hypothetical protein